MVRASCSITSVIEYDRRISLFQKFEFLMGQDLVHREMHGKEERYTRKNGKGNKRTLAAMMIYLRYQVARGHVQCNATGQGKGVSYRKAQTCA